MRVPDFIWFNYNKIRNAFRRKPNLKNRRLKEYRIILLAHNQKEDTILDLLVDSIDQCEGKTRNCYLAAASAVPYTENKYQPEFNTDLYPETSIRDYSIVLYVTESEISFQHETLIIKAHELCVPNTRVILEDITLYEHNDETLINEVHIT